MAKKKDYYVKAKTKDGDLTVSTYRHLTILEFGSNGFGENEVALLPSQVKQLIKVLEESKNHLGSRISDEELYAE